MARLGRAFPFQAVIVRRPTFAAQPSTGAVTFAGAAGFSEGLSASITFVGTAGFSTNAAATVAFAGTAAESTGASGAIAFTGTEAASANAAVAAIVTIAGSAAETTAASGAVSISGTASSSGNASVSGALLISGASSMTSAAVATVTIAGSAAETSTAAAAVSVVGSSAASANAGAAAAIVFAGTSWADQSLPIITQDWQNGQTSGATVTGATMGTNDGNLTPSLSIDAVGSAWTYSNSIVVNPAGPFYSVLRMASSGSVFGYANYTLAKTCGGIAASIYVSPVGVSGSGTWPPAGAWWILNFRTGANGALMAVAFNAAGKVVIIDSTGAQAVAGTLALVADTTYRIEVVISAISATAGKATVHVYDSTNTIVDTITSSTLNLGANNQIGQIRVGQGSGSNCTSSAMRIGWFAFTPFAMKEIGPYQQRAWMRGFVQTSGAGPTLTLTQASFSAPVQGGDLVIAAVTVVDEAGGAHAPPQQPSLGAGWSLLGSGNNGADAAIFLFERVAAGAAGVATTDGSYVLTTNISAGSTGVARFVVMAFANADIARITDGSVPAVSSGTGGGIISAPYPNALLGNGDMLVSLWMMYASGTTVSGSFTGLPGVPANTPAVSNGTSAASTTGVQQTAIVLSGMWYPGRPPPQAVQATNTSAVNYLALSFFVAASSYEPATAAVAFAGSAGMSTGAAGAVAFTGAAAESTGAAGAVTFTGSAAISTGAAGAIVVAGSASGGANAVTAGVVVFSGAAAGSTAAAGAVAFNGSAAASGALPAAAITITGASSVSTSAAGAVAFSGSSSGKANTDPSAAMIVNGSAAMSTGATAQIVVSGSAGAQGKASVSASISVSGSVSGQGTPGSSASVAFSGSVSYSTGAQGAVQITASAGPVANVGASASVSIVGSGSASGQLSSSASVTIVGNAGAQASAGALATIVYTATAGATAGGAAAASVTFAGAAFTTAFVGAAAVITFVGSTTAKNVTHSLLITYRVGDDRWSSVESRDRWREFTGSDRWMAVDSGDRWTGRATIDAWAP